MIILTVKLIIFFYSEHVVILKQLEQKIESFSLSIVYGDTINCVYQQMFVWG